MKKIMVLVAAASLMVACGGNSKKDEKKAAEAVSAELENVAGNAAGATGDVAQKDVECGGDCEGCADYAAADYAAADYAAADYAAAEEDFTAEDAAEMVAAAAAMEGEDW